MKDEYADEDKYLAEQRVKFRKPSAREIRKSDVLRVSISGLREYQDSQFVLDSLMEIHSPPLKLRHFVKRQAESIGYCLRQFFEYFEASKSRPYSRPTLMYYALMYLATVEILWKLDGRYSLERLRQRHPHHGLEFHVDQAIAKDPTPVFLRASLADRGTFNVWLRIAMCASLVGQNNFYPSQTPGPVIGVQPIFGPDGTVYKFKSASLGELARISPTCLERGTLSRLGSDLIRATVTRDYYELERKATYKIIIHPDDPKLLEKLYSNIRIKFGDISEVGITEYHSGLCITMQISDKDFRMIQLHEYINVDKDIVLLRSDDVSLNEFGVLYVASYISGMFARYYPELWAKSVDRHDIISQVVTNIMDEAEERGPLLLLGELRGIEYIFK